jgi:hypothetical protein
MTIENDALSRDLRAWLKSPAIGLQDYSTDMAVQRRVGRMLADGGVKPRAPNKAVNSIQTRFPDKL